VSVPLELFHIFYCVWTFFVHSTPLKTLHSHSVSDEKRSVGMTILGYKMLIHLHGKTFPAMVPNNTKHITTDKLKPITVKFLQKGTNYSVGWDNHHSLQFNEGNRETTSTSQWFSVDVKCWLYVRTNRLELTFCTVTCPLKWKVSFFLKLCDVLMFWCFFQYGPFRLQKLVTLHTLTHLLQSSPLAHRLTFANVCKAFASVSGNHFRYLYLCCRYFCSTSKLLFFRNTF
jgi:hypothetical protein